MYNTKTICTYKSYDDFSLSETAYRRDLLHIFNILDFDFEKHEKEINNEVEKVYNLIIENEKFLECIKKVSVLFNTNDLFIGFTLLMSYDFLYLSHPCICEFLDNNCVSEENFKDLLKNLE